MDEVVPRVSVVMPARVSSPVELDWLREAVNSVVAQTFDGWELVIVDDHSPEKKMLAALKREWKPDARIRWPRLPKEAGGVVAARNLAASEARGELLLPLDADDRLTPDAITKLLDGWEHGGAERGIVYGSVMRFGTDWTRLFHAPEYSFDGLLKDVIFPVTALHRKSDWEKVGGWKADFEAGLEDWEYWIALGEMGVCGHAIPDTVLWYRKKSIGRLAVLRDEPTAWKAACQKIRAMHQEVYNGRYTAMCCGRGRAAPVPGEMRMTPRGKMEYTPLEKTTLIQYIGGRTGNFGVLAPPSGIRYLVPGKGLMVRQPNGAEGVDSRDVQFFLRINRGLDFKVAE